MNINVAIAIAGENEFIYHLMRKVKKLFKHNDLINDLSSRFIKNISSNRINHNILIVPYIINWKKKEKISCDKTITTA